MDDHLARTREFSAPRAVAGTRTSTTTGPHKRPRPPSSSPARPALIVDLGCGTGRALPALRHVAGPHATIIGVDVTPEMLAAAADGDTGGSRRARPRRRGRAPRAASFVDTFFAAGLLGQYRIPLGCCRRSRQSRARAPDSRCSIRLVGPRSRHATNGRCSRTSCSIRRSCPGRSRGRAGRSTRWTTANRATSRSQRRAPSR